MVYDAVGNMTSQINGVQNLEKEVHYNSQNRISRVVNPQRPNQLVGQCWYDDQGFRVRKLARFDRGQGKNLEDVEILYTSKFFGMEITSAFTAVNNIYLNGVRVAAVTPNGGAVFYLTDQVDSVKLILDDNKAEVSRLEYLPYGETFVQKGNKDYAPKYNSQELDPETKFYFYNARYYDPEVARFTSADTTIDGEYDTQGWNRFAYVHGNPIRYRDPTGHGFGEAWNSFKEGVSERVGELKQAASDTASDPVGTAKAVYDAKVKEFKENPISTTITSVSPGAALLKQQAQPFMALYRAATSDDPAKALGRASVDGGIQVAENVATLMGVKALGRIAQMARPAPVLRAGPVESPAGRRTPDFVVTEKGTCISTCQSQMRKGFDQAGFPSKPTESPGTEHTLPNGNKVRLMEPSGNAPRRASFTNANGGPVTPDGDVPQPPRGMTSSERRDFVREKTHLTQEP